MNSLECQSRGMTKGVRRAVLLVAIGVLAGLATATHGAIPPGCPGAVSPASLSVPASGGAGSISVLANSGCTWSAWTTSSWISVSDGSMTGNGRVGYTVSKNSGASRTGTIKIGGKSVTVKQSAASTAAIAAGGEPEGRLE